MTALSPQLLFTALAFTSVVGRDGLPSEDKAPKITALAGLMDAYCRAAVPEAFAPTTKRRKPVKCAVVQGHDDDMALSSRMASAIVAVLERQGTCEPSALATHGFSPEDIERCWPLAKALAEVERLGKPRIVP